MDLYNALTIMMVGILSCWEVICDWKAAQAQDKGDYGEKKSQKSRTISKWFVTYTLLILVWLMQEDICTLG